MLSERKTPRQVTEGNPFREGVASAASIDLYFSDKEIFGGYLNERNAATSDQGESL